MQQEIGLFQNSDDISNICESCDASCCRNMRIYLTDEEFTALTDAGTELRLIEKKEQGKKLYFMNGDCGNLDPTQKLSCTHYEERPESCRKFRPGSEACSYAREEGFDLL